MIDPAESEGSVFNKSPWALLILLNLVYLLILIVKHEILVSDNLLAAGYQGNDFDGYLSSLQYFRWFKYFFIMLWANIQILLVSVGLIMACRILNINPTIPKIFNVVILAQLVYVLDEVVIIVWFGFIQKEFTVYDVFNFESLSLIRLVAVQEGALLKSFVLRSLDIYFVVYVVVLLYELSYLFSIPRRRAATIVLVGYVVPVALLLSVAFAL